MPAAKTKILGLAAALVLVVSLVVIIRRVWSPSPRGPEQTWFYDLNTGQLFPAPITEIPPMAAPSGPRPDGQLAGVKAHVYGCGDCAGAHRIITYLETYTPEQKQELLQWKDRAMRIEPPANGQPFIPSPNFAAVLSGQAALIKRPADADWVMRGSAEGLTLANESLPQCPGAIAPQVCWP